MARLVQKKDNWLIGLTAAEQDFGGSAAWSNGNVHKWCPRQTSDLMQGYY